MVEFKDGRRVKPKRHNFTEGINENHTDGFRHITSTLLVVSNLKDGSSYQQFYF